MRSIFQDNFKGIESYNIIWLYYSMKTADDVIELLGCSRGTVSHYVKNNILVVTAKSGRKMYFSDDSVEKAKKHYLEKVDNNLPKEQKKLKKTTVYLSDQIEDKTGKDDLGELGKQIMADTIDELKLLGIYRVNDNYAIYDYAKTYETYIHYTNKSSKNDVQKDSKGTLKISPYVSLCLQFGKLVDDKRKRLGLDPASREKLTVKEIKELDEMADMFK